MAAEQHHRADADSQRDGHVDGNAYRDGYRHRERHRHTDIDGNRNFDIDCDG